MLGNLSKILMKAPDFFNNSSLNETNEFAKSNQKQNINVFHSNKYIKPRKKNFRDIYFREKDFWLKNYEPDINYNHNRRLPFSLKKYKLKKDTKKLELPKNLDNSGKFNTINVKKSRYFLTDRQNQKKDKSSNNNIFSIYKINSLNTHNNSDNELCLKTESNRIANRISFNLDTNNTENSDFISININDEKKVIETIDNKKKRYKFNSEFPLIYKGLKSQENLFQDKLDRKFNSLKLIKPEIKEQLKAKNRNMVGRKDFLRYQSLNRANFPNPFYECIKFKEELKNINLKQK